MTERVEDGVDRPTELLGLIARSLGRQGIEQVLCRLHDAERQGQPGILVDSGDSSPSPYVMSVGPEEIDFMYGGEGPFVLPLSTLVEWDAPPLPE